MITQAEKDNRIQEVAKRLCLHQTRFDILQYGAKEWGLQNRQIDDYIALATEKLRQTGNTDLVQEKGEAIERAIIILKASIKASQFRNALTANEQIIKLHGLYAPDKKDVNLTLDTRILVDGDSIDDDTTGD